MPAFLYILTHGEGEMYVVLDVCNICAYNIYILCMKLSDMIQILKKKLLQDFKQ